MHLKSPEELEQHRAKILDERKAREGKKGIVLCTGTGCRGAGALEVYEAFKQSLGTTSDIEFKPTCCHGFCERGPITVVEPTGTFYQRVSPDDVPRIIAETVQKGQVLEDLLYQDPTTEQKIPAERDIPFYKKQKRLVFGQNRLIDPTRIEDYIAKGGYQALAKALFHLSPEEIIAEVKRAGLRGRGGGGFPAGRKWESCRRAHGDVKYVICNCDEGDPGAYMDRSLMEGNPHRVLEGMIIGAYAIGASEGYIYVRHEYPLAVDNAGIAIEQARKMGFLGKNILGSGFDFEVKISRGGGAFVAGESTALMASIEGFVAEPRAKHIHTVESGLWDKPTNLNNVETWANVPLIVEKGADWYIKIGTEGSKGTKIFSLVGKINNTGLIEVPMGMTLREIVYDIGGGIPGGKRFKAVQTGGPSGGCIPEKLLDLPVDFDELTKAGSMMGSGGMIVMDESTCMVDVAKYFTHFLKDESCGKCTSCRDGTLRMYEILDAITKGKGKEGDIELLEEIGWATTEASLCALGGTAANPVLSTIRYFRDEYEAHIKDKRCPAGVCPDLITYTIDAEACIACMKCKKECPTKAITGEKKVPHEIIQEKCIKCGTCKEVCPVDAVKVE
ncbi:MAG: NADH-ubiquinone oxidoreductase-F iron-sulfur binding region domain-containing protein [Deltaproteobacteria bacterium]|jgi:NADH:ubiquinone oxidoreductase subunit F (NADH-binding)/(2Fe-2S) ferredoxin/Pyruvate/2-oxoacid:ferredoxin oxidoreductase delta subunit